MDHKDRVTGFLAALAGMICVAGGAFGAHILKGTIPAVDLAAFDTGMRYGLVHAIAALVALVLKQHSLPNARGASWSFLLGILLFTGSLGVLGLTGSRALVLLTPLGGLTFILGWALLGTGFLRTRKQDEDSRPL